MGHVVGNVYIFGDIVDKLFDSGCLINVPIVLIICIFGPRLVDLLVWCSLIGRSTSGRQALRLKPLYCLHFAVSD